MPDKYAATWVSYSSISDFQQCPRAYYLKNVYKNPETGNKIQIASPALSLGGAVHEVVESLSVLPSDQRFKESLLKKFDKVWQKISGKKGGFFDKKIEMKYKKRGEEMIRKIITNPGPVGELAIKLKEDLPNYWLSEEDEIILCGKVDWLQYSPDEDTVRVIDFKTSTKKEKKESLQLPIYLLLVSNTQKRAVNGMSYWYLELSDNPEEVELPDLGKAHKKILAIAKEVKLARKLNRFRCPNEEAGCMHCKPFEKILKGEAEFVNTDPEYRRDIFVLPPREALVDDSYIL